MQTFRKLIFGVFAILAVLFLFIGIVALNKKQRRKMEELLDKLVETVEDFKDEVLTIEDEMLLAEMEVTQEDYRKGTNEDLSVECRICGENTPRGKYYCRKDCTTPHVPYAFICKDCYRILPKDEDEKMELRLSQFPKGEEGNE